jgi:hypothetical protein
MLAWPKVIMNDDSITLFLDIFLCNISFLFNFWPCETYLRGGILPLKYNISDLTGDSNDTGT